MVNLTNFTIAISPLILLISIATTIAIYKKIKKETKKCKN